MSVCSVSYFPTPTELVGIMSAYNYRSYLLSQEGTHGIHMKEMSYADTGTPSYSWVFFIGHFLFKTWSGVSYPDATCHRITTFLNFKRNIALPPHTFACALAFIWQAKCIGAAQPKLVTLFSGAQSGWWLKLILNFPDEKTLLIEVFLSALCS